MQIRNIINKILFYGFLAWGIILLFVGTSRTFAMLATFGSFFASWSLSEILKRKGIDMKYELFINIAFWLNLAGEFVLYYGGFLYYDKLLHFSVAFMITAGMYGYFLKSLKPKKDMIFFTVLGMLAIWEIFEYSIQTFFNIPMMGVLKNSIIIQTPLDDTMADLIWGGIGSMVYLLFKKENVGKVIT